MLQYKVTINNFPEFVYLEALNPDTGFLRVKDLTLRNLTGMKAKFVENNLSNPKKIFEAYEI